MKQLWIVANWKSNKTITEAMEWLSIIGPKIDKREEIKIIVCPTFADLSEVKNEISARRYPIFLGSQDISPFGVGSFTGEEPATLLSQIVSYSIIGHSERRENFGETDEMVAKKFKQASESGIESIVCIQNEETLIPQGCKIVAYEPIFAIGTGNPDAPENAQKIAETIKTQRGYVNVLYGGSVTSENCTAFVSQKDISGLLIGKASLNPQEFLNIIKNCDIA